MSEKLIAFAGLAMTCLTFSFTPALAEYPEKLVKIVTPFAAGGSTDVAARIVADGLSKEWGVEVIVENRPGHAGNIHAKNAAADGYTLLLGTSSIPIYEATTEQPLYTIENDFRTAALVSSFPQFFVTNKALGVTDLPGFLEKINTSQQSHHYATSGIGSNQHIQQAAFVKAAGLNMIHVPFSGGVQARTDLLAGRASLALVPPEVLLDNDQMVVLGVGGRERSPFLPDVPTMGELGMTEFSDLSSWQTWFAIMTPKATPDEIVERVNQAVNATLRRDDVIKRLNDLAHVNLGGYSVEAASQFVKTESEQWSDVAKYLDLTPN